MEELLFVDSGNTVSHILCLVSAVRKNRRKEKRKPATETTSRHEHAVP
jgi:hypothetical protein